jgi:hypothetical protein
MNNNCSCIKNENQAFDFVVTYYDCKGLVFSDISNWMVDDGYKVPEEFNIEITLPSGSTVNKLVRPLTSTIILSSELSGSKCLQDGIYCFKVTSCGIPYSRVKAVVCSLKCKLNNLIAKSDDTGLINEISNDIEGIKVSADMGLELQAKDLYSKVEKRLNKLDCSCICR